MTVRPPFRRLLVANRGEIAVRIIRACRELGIEAIAVHSEADVDAVHARLADRSILIGPASPALSYLSVERIVEAARSVRAEEIHPGYGFLSENAAFARAVEAEGIVFVGPPPAAIEALGDKLAARRSAAAAGVPLVPGLTVPLDAAAEAGLDDIGYPLMLKAAAGGGGRGMRRVDAPGELAAALATAGREAASAFGDGTIYAERLIEPARHVEIQLLGDRHGKLICLGERDCSVQRRHQKLVEESPSPAVTPDIRDAMFDSARRVAGGVAFHSAATVEFLLDAQGRHYFLEMNTRLQVEHGVTELVTGLDLVAWQIRIAAGEPLPDDLGDRVPAGHAIEVRLYAEDPWDGFRPVAGDVTAFRMPGGPGIRVDAGVEAGTRLPAEYDPLLAKLLVHAEDRATAIARLRRALDETLIGGVQTDAGFLRWLVDDEAFVTGRYDTGLVARRWDRGPDVDPRSAAIAAAAVRAARPSATGATSGPEAEPGVVRAWTDAARREALHP